MNFWTNGFIKRYKKTWKRLFILTMISAKKDDKTEINVQQICILILTRKIIKYFIKKEFEILGNLQTMEKLRQKNLLKLSTFLKPLFYFSLMLKKVWYYSNCFIKLELYGAYRNFFNVLQKKRQKNPYLLVSYWRDCSYKTICG